MLATLASAAVVCAASFLLGQAVMQLCGARRWTWLSPPVGLVALMLLTVPALHVPGRSATVGIVVGLLVIAVAVQAARGKVALPPASSLLALVPAALLVWVPFLSAGRFGTLGVSVNNDMASHLGWAEAYRSQAAADTFGLQSSYPLGPHAVVAALAECFGIAVDLAFAGLTAATPVILAATALAVLRPGAPLLGKALVATLVGLPFLVAGYYGQGSFKEVMQTTFVLAIVLALRQLPDVESRLRWIPVGLLAAGVLSVYSSPGLLWPVVIAAVWLAGLAVTALRRGRLGEAGRAVRGELVPLAIGVLATLLVLAPQLPRLVRFFTENADVNGTGIETSSLGNLAAPLPLWEAFGVWDSPDYRFGPVDAFGSGMWSAFALALVVAGAVWMIRRGDWLLPAVAAAAFGIWVLSDRTQSPYVTAKALVILAPMLMLLAVVPFAEARAWAPRLPRGALIAVWMVGGIFAVKALDDSWDALRVSPVAPRAHLLELRELQPLLGRKQTLFLGNDDFVRWELAGTPVTAPVVGIPQVPIRPEKQWQYGQAHDFDSVEPAQLNTYTWVVTTRDAAGSTPPPQFERVRSTRSFDVWRREGTVEPRSLLTEAGGSPVARLDCATPEGRAVSRRSGSAAVRDGSVGVPVGVIAPGASARATLPLSAGTWDIGMDYGSHRAIEVTGPGVRTVMPANLDRPGPRWRVGRVTVPRAERVTLRLRVQDDAFALRSAVANVASVMATPATGERMVPLRRACGRLVDWYRLGS